MAKLGEEAVRVEPTTQAQQVRHALGRASRGRQPCTSIAIASGVITTGWPLSAKPAMLSATRESAGSENRCGTTMELLEKGDRPIV